MNADPTSSSTKEGSAEMQGRTCGNDTDADIFNHDEHATQCAFT